MVANVGSDAIALVQVFGETELSWKARERPVVPRNTGSSFRFEHHGNLHFERVYRDRIVSVTVTEFVTVLAVTPG